MQTQTTSETIPKPSVVALPSRRDGLFAFEIRMPVTREDFREMAVVLSDAYEEHGSIDLLVRIVGGLHFSFELLREQLFEVKREALKHVDRYAVVGGPGWLQTAIALIDPLFRIEVRHFDGDHEDDAWQWLQPLEEAP